MKKKPNSECRITNDADLIAAAPELAQAAYDMLEFLQSEEHTPWEYGRVFENLRQILVFASVDGPAVWL